MSEPPEAWNATTHRYQRGATIPEAFRRQAAATPDADALRTLDGRRIAYRDLDRASDHCAAVLAGHGVGPGAIVPVLLPRSPELAMVLLGVLKAGGAYVGVDPDAPPARLAAVVERVDPPLTVGTGTEPVDAPIWVPPAVEDATRLPSTAPAAVGTGGDPCCVFFTSGTTGRAKGAVVPHRAILRLFEGDRVGEYGPGMVRPAATPTAWDVGSYEIWASLVTGGTMVPVAEPYPSPALLRRMRDELGVNATWLTTTLFNLYVDEDLGALAGLRQVHTGGERLSPPHVARFLDRYPDIPLVNGYGPVESTVFSTVHRIRRADADAPDGIPIGVPIQNTAIHVLAGDRVCAVDEPGELCIAGDGLALGYLDDPQLTARQFVHVDIAGRRTRVYRTGDLARWAPDGTLRYLGRSDRQVKIRGHRVEPLEVERRLREVPGVVAAVVLARPGPDGSYRDLAGFYTTADGIPVEDAVVLQRLRRDLPEYAVPSSVRQVPAFPRTANGKLDSDALLAVPAAGDTDPAAAERAVPSPGPADGVAGTVTEVVRAVLRESAAVDRPPAWDESLFALGATSLDLGRIAVRLQDRLGVGLPVSWLAAHPTPAAIAARVRTAAEHGPDPAPAPEPGSGPASEPVPLTTTQAAFWLDHLLDPADLDNSCLLGWDVTGPVDVPALTRAAAAVHARHDALHARYPAGEEPVAVPVRPGTPDVRVLATPPDGPAGAAVAADAAVAAVAAELADPFDLDAGRVWRLVVVAAGPDRTVVGIAVHHIAFDGWSEHLLAADLAACYRAELAARPAPPAPAGGLAAVAAERARRRAVVDLDAQRAYWSRTLAAPPELSFPPGDGDDSGGRQGLEMRVSGGWSVAGDAARVAGTSPFVVLLSGYAAAVADVTGAGDLLVGFPTTFRDTGLSATTVGCLVETCCARLHPRGGGDLAAALAAGRSDVEAALAARDVPYGEAARLGREPSTPGAPAFGTLFALQDAPPARLPLPGCVSRPVWFRPPAMMFDLVCEAYPAPDGALALRLTWAGGAVSREVATQVAVTVGKQLGGWTAPATG
jgi:amino acid adenylation domain-containing protein